MVLPITGSTSIRVNFMQLSLVGTLFEVDEVGNGKQDTGRDADNKHSSSSLKPKLLAPNGAHQQMHLDGAL